MGFLYALLEFFALICAVLGTLGSAFMTWLLWFESGEEFGEGFGEDWFMSFGMLLYPLTFLYMIYYWIDKFS